MLIFSIQIELMLFPRFECIFYEIPTHLFQVVKNRFSGDLGTMPLFFNRGTLTFSKKIFQKERSSSSTQQKRVKKEVDISTKEPSKSGFVIDDEQDHMS